MVRIKKGRDSAIISPWLWRYCFGGVKELITRKRLLFPALLFVVGFLAIYRHVRPSSSNLLSLLQSPAPEGGEEIKTAPPHVTTENNRSYYAVGTSSVGVENVTTTALTVDEVKERQQKEIRDSIQEILSRKGGAAKAGGAKVDLAREMQHKRRHYRRQNEKYKEKKRRERSRAKHHREHHGHTARTVNDENLTGLSGFRGHNNYTQAMAHGIRDMYLNHTSRYCLTQQCIHEIALPLARAFPDKPNHETWCIPKGDNTTENRKHKGLILVKVPKAASSTTAGVVLRLGHRHNCDLDFVHWHHERAYQNFAYRLPEQSFILASVRDPGAQLVSNFFWTFITLRRIAPEDITDEFMVRRIINFGTNLGMVRHHQGGLQTQFVAFEKIPKHAAWSDGIRDLINPQDTIARVKSILEGYDFILVVERMDESLVALALILNVPVGEVVVASSKVAAPTGEEGTSKVEQLSYVYSYKLDRCLPVRSSFHPPLLEGYLKSDLFRSQSYGDLILHAAANRSLDLTIERLGVERFQAALKEYQYWKQKEKEDCADRVEFPCSSNAEPQLDKARLNCYDGDIGCGHECLDEMLAKGKYVP